MHYGWIWIALFVLAIIIEIFTEKFISIWFVAGASVALILDLCHISIWWQIGSFVAASAIAFLLAKFLLSNYIRLGGGGRTNIESIVGSKCVVVEKIDNYSGCGMAKVNGQLWSARSVTDEEVYEPGEVLRIVAIEGVKLICKKQ